MSSELFFFDLEKAADRYPAVACRFTGRSSQSTASMVCDAERFSHGFDQPKLADDLLTVFEHGRIQNHLRKQYPGLVKRCLPVLQAEFERHMADHGGHCLNNLYGTLALSMAPADRNPAAQDLLAELSRPFERLMALDGSVHMAAELVCHAYPVVAAGLNTDQLRDYQPLPTPFGRRPHWHMVAEADRHARTALALKEKLARSGIRVYRSDLQQRMQDGQGLLAAEDIHQLAMAVAKQNAGPGATRLKVDLDRLDLATILGAAGKTDPLAPPPVGAYVTYPEWDLNLNDYLQAHVRVYERSLHHGGSRDVYGRILARHSGLVSRMRRAFELLKPEGISILRQWPEGDSFDYRALLDFAVDRRAGRTPSERLYIKRLKHQRDVAVLLLVDLSRSTANRVSGGRQSVLDLAREAVVLFCEALQIVGDRYAVAGFSGTGRHAVDYYRIKSFGQHLDDRSRQAIAAMAPQRSTRMGAAIRHAASRLAQVPARVHLMIVVGDGFPNDLGYKGDYAIADTRRAIQEARARSVHVKAITVNIGSDPRLDDVFGRFHHYIIGDVRELPDQLLRLYSALTRH